MPKPFRAARASAFGLALAMAAAPAGAAQAHFDFSIAGIRVGALSMAIEREGARYTAKSRIDTAGVVGAFIDFFFDGTASGTVGANGKVVPRVYTATSKSPRALRHSRIDWKDGTPVAVSVEPPRDSAPDPSKQTGTLDPVSASFRLLRDAPAAEVCDVTVIVFDGSRLSRLAVSPGVRQGGRLVCDGAYARLEGEASSIANARNFPFKLVFSVDADGFARLESVEAPTNFGRAVVARRD